MRPYRVAFLGSPKFACPVFQAVHDSEQFIIECLITQPDRPSGRGQKLSPTPLKELALRLDVPVFEPVSLKTLSVDATQDSAHSRIKLVGTKSSAPLAEFLNSLPHLDIMISVAYGNIIPEALLNYCPGGIVNIHPSLLPRWRGAAPIQLAIFSGDEKTGVSLMRVDAGLDTGPVFFQQEIPICREDTFGSLHDKLSALSADMLLSVLPRIMNQELVAEAQDDTTTTYADKWSREDCSVDWSDPADVISRRIRTCSPDPGARTSLNGEILKIFSAEAPTEASGHLPSPIVSGTVTAVYSDRIAVSCGDGHQLLISELQLAGKRRMVASEFIRGQVIKKGMVLGQ